MELNLYLYFIYSRLKLLYILSTLFISMHELRNTNVHQSEIKLVIKGSGYSNFLSDDFNIEPYEVKINGEINDLCKKSCSFNNDLNNVTIKFNETIISCENMFNGLENIREIDLSNFDASKVERMDSMFSNCINLEKINFGKINTSSVKLMNNSFSNCKKLTSIDVSDLNTSSVITMKSMFSQCESLTSIDASNLILKMLKIWKICLLIAIN